MAALIQVLQSAMVILFLYSVVNSASTKNEECPLYENFRDSKCFTSNQIDASLYESPVVWVVEFYSSWCGHCHHFSPTWKSVATRIKNWYSLVRMGQIDCTQSTNRDKCSQYHIEAFPTIKIFKAHTEDPHSKDIEKYVGRRSEKLLMEYIINHIGTLPSLEPLNTINTDSVDVLIFEDTEDTQSILGKEIILDFLSSEITIRRVSLQNVELSRHYSILELPSLVILTSQHHTVISRSAAGKDGVKEYFENVIKESIINKKREESLPAINNNNNNNNKKESLVKESSIGTRSRSLIKRVTMTDLLSTLSYCLRYEVKLKHVIDNEDFSSLYQFVYHIEKVFHLLNKVTVSDDLRGILTKLDRKGGFITNAEWQIILRQKIHNTTLPDTPIWSTCQGSSPQYRGFPCGLWTLLHTSTILTLNITNNHHAATSSSRQVLNSMINFVTSFFSCQECRSHFSKLTNGLWEKPLNYDGDAILWLWEAHNIVNRRLRESPSSDPAHPKTLFPPYHICPYCYQRVKNKDKTSFNESPNWENVALESHYIKGLSSINTLYVWNETAVFLFLCNFYGQGHYNNVSHVELIQAAWPRRYPLSSDRHYAIHGIHPSTPTSLSSTSLLLYMLAMVIVLAYMFNYKLKRTRFKSQ